jgi:uncharacterized protein YndB with AHSA1/START domain
MNQDPRLNTALDLAMTRLFRAPVAAFWRCWTEPHLLMKWWAPSPDLTTEAVIEPWPGGRLYTNLLHRDGSFAPVEACILRADPEHCLVFTDLMERGYRPAACPALGYTATVTFAPESGGTRVAACLQYGTPAARQLHEDAGFHESWGIAISQLGSLADGLRG